MREVDPDIITGYNIQNFDIPYLMDRAAHFKLKEFDFLGRIKNIRSTVRVATIQSKQMGKRENKIVNMEGRVQFDLLQVGFRLVKRFQLNFYLVHLSPLDGTLL